MFELRDDRAATAAPATTSLAPTAATAEREGMPVDPRRLLGALSRGKKILLGSLLLGAIGGVILAKTVIPREYTAAAAIAWEPGPPLMGDAKPEPRELRTLVDSMKVPGNLAEARRRLGIPATVDELGARVNVASNEKSNLVSVAATWGDPDMPPRIANTVVEVFLEQRLEASRSRSEALLATLSSDAETARAALTAARKAYDDFRKENGIADLPIETQVAIEQAAKLRAEADLARADAEGELARAESLRTAAGKQPRTTVLSTTEVRPQALKLADNESALAAARGSMSPEHPGVVALAAQTEGLRQAANSPSVVSQRVLGRNPNLDAIHQILEGSAAQREAALKRHAALTELAALADQRIARLSVVEGRATELLTGVRLAEAHLGDIEKSRARVADVARSPVASFRVVDPAMRPERPSKSHRRLFAMVAPIAAVILAAGFLIARALRGARVHTARELAWWGRGPVVASTTWPSEARAVRDLTVDLWAFAVQTHGTTLVVPMSAGERDMAEKVAAALNPPELLEDGQHGDAALARATVWDGDDHGPELRRVARLADRVLVVVSAGAHSATEVDSVLERVGRKGGVGYVLLNVGSDLAKLPDRAGDVGRFWRRSGPEVGTPGYEVMSHA
jgi:uncharacterized protein involved in exopolysaccharide biosynthesis